MYHHNPSEQKIVLLMKYPSVQPKTELKQQREAKQKTKPKVIKSSFQEPTDEE